MPAAKIGEWRAALVPGEGPATVMLSNCNGRIGLLAAEDAEVLAADLIRALQQAGHRVSVPPAEDEAA